MLQIGRQADGMHCHASLVGNVFQQMTIQRAEGFARRARRDKQLTDGFRLIDERQANHVRLRLAIGDGPE